ncbi:hydrolase [Vibrio aquaticus]|uniref:Hydrolase n=1 Tax=Vibrio aquaticus TaxID=2496559 RepID=A0A432CY51_9VIBR|nr:NlpC/P60 family protein [Vibrio aquaticus]RTZ16819.1 hydrolase [Vibrio aquaticus]
MSIIKNRHFQLGLLSSLLIGCSSSSQHDFNQPTPNVIHSEHQIAQQKVTKSSLLDIYQVWKGAPYRLGGTTLGGVDCSAFVQTAYKDGLGLTLPRTTLAQVEIGKEIEYSEAMIGDLVFFKTAPNTRHVGVYLGNKQFMHASTSKGVIISRLDNPYWASKYWHFRRVNYSPTSL